MFVLVVDTNKKPLNPTHPARARKLLKAGKAAVYRRYPFTIILKKEVEDNESKKPEYRLKIDPGSRVTGLAILRNDVVIWAGELTHRGLTKFNRCRQSLPKTHWLDASNVGKSTPEKLKVLVDKPLLIKATGHGTRQMCRTDKFGFVRFVPYKVEGYAA